MANYEFIIGKRLSDFYMQQIYSRKWTQESEITTLKSLIEVINKELKEGLKNATSIPIEVTPILSEFASLIDKAETDTEIVTAKIRELLSLLSYYDIEVYFISREDLQIVSKTDEDDSGTVRAYLIDNYDKVFPRLSRIGGGYCKIFDVPEDMSIPDMIFGFIGKIVRFEQLTSDLLKVNDLMDKYDALKRVGAAYSLNLKDLQRFLQDYGFTIFGIV